MKSKTKKAPKAPKILRGLTGMFGGKIEQGKLYEFNEIPLEISRSIADLWRRDQRDVLELLAGLWMWEGGDRWKMMKRDQK